jgi:hypothetical protein
MGRPLYLSSTLDALPRPGSVRKRPRTKFLGPLVGFALTYVLYRARVSSCLTPIPPILSSCALVPFPLYGTTLYD